MAASRGRSPVLCVAGMRRAVLGVISVALVSCPVQPPGDLTCEAGGTGCGPFFLGPIVPLYANCFEVACDGATTVVCFTCSCNGHDTCYGICGSDKGDCDLQFLDAMLETCGETFPGACGYNTCMIRAFFYAALVSSAGDLSFDSGQAGCGRKAADRAAAAYDSRLALGTALPFVLPYEDEDGDLLPDDWERAVGLDPTDPGDAHRDDDRDGLVNLGEFLMGTQPHLWDSDGDGIDDTTEALLRGMAGH